MHRHDVIIMGGGLAGLTLAIQLRQRLPDLDVLVLERRPHPLKAAAHKVGESSVEIGGNYFAKTLGLEEHMTTAQIRKFGYRFFWSEGRRDLENVTEFGVREVLPAPSYQIDRGIFETFLGEEAARRGARFLDGCVVRGFDLGGEHQDHVVRYERNGEKHEAAARWLIDAAGRASLIKRKLDLRQDNDHDANAVWFRIDDLLAIDDWNTDAEWTTRCTPPERWRSTNHLCGPGYWVWLIPLSSGAHSVGIVCDGKMHPLERMNTFDKAMEWMREFQPLVADHVEARRDKLMDFLFFRHFSYGCKQVFSGDRWALTGEAGLFLDPFYSPGSDYICISNTYITELVARDLAGEPIAAYAHLYQKLYFSFYENTLALYQDQYPMFGNPEAMPLKVIWDYAYYWGVLCLLVIQNRLTDTALLGEFAPELERTGALNRQMQLELRQWHERGGHENRAVMLDHDRLDWFYRLNIGLLDQLDDAGVRVRFRENLTLLDNLAASIRARIDGTDVLPGATRLDLFDRHFEVSA